MKIVKWVCGILLALPGAGLVFVGAVGRWESLTSGKPTGLILMLPTAALGEGLIWLGVRLLRGHPDKQVQEQAPPESEKAEKEARKKAELTALEEQREKLRRERLLQARQRWLEKQRLEEQWLEGHPALKARFDYLQAMLSRDVLSFYDPSRKECGHMSDCRNRTGGEWMWTLPVYDLEQVAAFYRDLWDARDHLTPEELEHAPDRLRGTINALTHRRLYLRLNTKHQLTALGDRKDAMLERFREQDVHLILQPSLNGIVDLTIGAVYDLHVEEMGCSPLTDEIVGGEVTLVPAERGSGMDRRRIAPDAERRYSEMLDLIEIDEDAERRFQQMLDRARTLASENPALIARLERVKEAFSCGLLNALRHPSCIERSDADETDRCVPISCAVAPQADLDQVIDIWLGFRAAEAELPQEIRRDCEEIGHLNLFLADDGQLENSAGGTEALLRRCRESGISLILNLGDRYYQDLDTGRFYTFVIEDCRTGNADDREFYEELEWHEVPPLPARPSQPWPEVPADKAADSPETR